MNILFVDDEESIRELFVEFHKSEHSIDLAVNGLEAFEKASNIDYDLIISDISLPKMSGLELIEELRRTGKNSPFIVITGDSDIEIAIKTFRLGAIDFFLKPFKMSALKDRIQKLNINKVDKSEVSLDHIAYFDLSFRLHFSPEIRQVPKFVDHICSHFDYFYYLPKEDLFSIKIVLHELIANAIEHGVGRIKYFEKKAILESGEDYYSRVEDACRKSNEKVLVSIRANEQGFHLTVEDPGEGFDLNSVPNPIENPTRNLVSGRGIFLSRMNIDSITYNEKGNRVEVFKSWSIQKEPIADK